MKTALITIAAAFFLVAVPVHAQDHASQLSFSGGGGGMGYGGGGFSSSIVGGASFSSPGATNRAEHYTYTYAQGSTDTYNPTHFVSFATGLKLAKEMLAYRPKSLGEIAAEYRAGKKQAK
jgi:hypothetical protein